MKSRTCPHCLRPLPMDDVAAVLPRIKRRIYEAVAEAGALGISRDGIMAEVYGHAADGGALCDDIIKVHVCSMNKILADFGVRIRSSKHRYFLIEA